MLCLSATRHINTFNIYAPQCAGTWAYWVTIICQWINIIGGNIGLTILGGQALKGCHDLYNDNQNIKLADWMIVTGVINGIFSLAVPMLHGLRLWSGIACACTIVFVAIVIGVAAYDGAAQTFFHLAAARCLQHLALPVFWT